MHFVWPRLARNSDVLIVPADNTRKILQDYGVSKPIRVIPNGIELSKFSSPSKVLNKEDLGLPEDAILMIFVGRMSSEKNIYFLLNEFSVASQIDRRLHLLLVGSGPLLKNLSNTIHRLGLENKIQMVGEIDNSRVPAYLNAADFFVTASTTEVHPLTLLEAMASGLPVVALSSPGTDAVVSHGITGLLAKDQSFDLADKMIIMAENASFRCVMAHNASLASKYYDIRHTISRSLSLYEEMLAEKRRHLNYNSSVN